MVGRIRANLAHGVVHIGTVLLQVIDFLFVRLLKEVGWRLRELGLWHFANTACACTTASQRDTYFVRAFARAAFWRIQSLVLFNSVRAFVTTALWDVVLFAAVV